MLESGEVGRLGHLVAKTAREQDLGHASVQMEKMHIQQPNARVKVPTLILVLNMNVQVLKFSLFSLIFDFSDDMSNPQFIGPYFSEYYNVTNLIYRSHARQEGYMGKLVFMDFMWN